MTPKNYDYARILQAILDQTGENQTDAARRLGATQPTFSRWLNRQQEPEKVNHDRILQVARELGIVSVVEQSRHVSVPIIGYVQAGGEAVLHAEGQGPFGEAKMPPKGAKEYTVAVIVRGDSMPGIAQDGWLLYYDDRHEPPEPELYGKLCVAELHDGRIVVKKLLQGSKPGHFHLISAHGDPLLDQRVTWAAKVSWIEPR